MAPKRARFLAYGNDAACEETKKFLENSGIVLEYRDLAKKPLDEQELGRLIGHLNINHFVNTASEAYRIHFIDNDHPDRDALIKLMAQDNSLIRRPIIQSNRLITIGCDRSKITEMLQLSANGESTPEENARGGNERENKRRNASYSQSK